MAGLQRYEVALRENEIDRDVLPELEESNLEKLRIPLEPRKLLLKAIKALEAGARSRSHRLLPLQSRAHVNVARHRADASRWAG
jgi:SAM domain (Sterile alpha motif)